MYSLVVVGGAFSGRGPEGTAIVGVFAFFVGGRKGGLLIVVLVLSTVAEHDSSVAEHSLSNVAAWAIASVLASRNRCSLSVGTIVSCCYCFVWAVQTCHDEI